MRRSDWETGLPAVRRELTERWRLTVDSPFAHDGECSWVAPAHTALGEPVVLKLGWWHSEALHEPDALRLWQGNGAVRLHASAELHGTIALLLERCRPGTLLRSVREPEQDVVVAKLLRRLWIRPPEGHPFRPLHQMCDQWAAGFDERLATNPGVLDPGLAREGRRLWVSLPRSSARNVLLCTDLHAGNILAAGREPWLAIDPKPYLGDPAYDVLQHMLNCDDRLAVDPAGLAARMADLLDLDRERVRLWLFARCVVESHYQQLGPAVAERLAP